ncbi:hypothetical protein SEVIR_9G317001v4 [Setaria viridis]
MSSYSKPADQLERQVRQGLAAVQTGTRAGRRGQVLLSGPALRLVGSAAQALHGKASRQPRLCCCRFPFPFHAPWPTGVVCVASASLVDGAGGVHRAGCAMRFRS